MLGVVARRAPGTVGFGIAHSKGTRSGVPSSLYERCEPMFSLRWRLNNRNDVYGREPDPEPRSARLRLPTPFAGGN